MFLSRLSEISWGCEKILPVSLLCLPDLREYGFSSMMYSSNVREKLTEIASYDFE